MPISVNILMALVGPTSTIISRVKDWSETYKEEVGSLVKFGTADVDNRRKGNVVAYRIFVPVGMDVTAVYPVKIEGPG